MKKIALLLCLLSTSVWADEQPRLVSVTGEGEVFTVPDEIWINLQIEAFDPVLAKAKEANDEAIRAVLAIVKKYKVDEKDFRTDYFTVRNDERYYIDPQSQQQKSKRGFFVTKSVAVVVRDVTKFEPLYSEALEAGITHIFGVEFRSSEMKKHREEARKLAVRDAKEKAQQLAVELGQELGRPHSISENFQQDWPQPRMMMAMDASKASSGDATIALGQIKITVSVSASFELK